MDDGPSAKVLTRSRANRHATSAFALERRDYGEEGTVTERRTRAIFGALLLTLYLSFTIPLIAILPIEAGVSSWLLVTLYIVIALGLAVDLTELLFSALPKPESPPRLIGPLPACRVAVLYLCCDDADQASMAALHRLRGRDVFILDDSKSAAARAWVDRSQLTVIRRGGASGYKAGNLNNWLHQYGPTYDYFIVLDNDSLMSSTAIDELLAYAEHPANSDVAIVQATNLPRPGNRFQRFVGLPSVLRGRILARVHVRLGWTLSNGHNNLHRTCAVRAVGGFPTTASCEDTLVSFALRAEAWRILLVETRALEGEPSEPFAYRRRYVRWARQTVDVLLCYRKRLPKSLVVLMARHLLAYLIPLAGVGIVALTVLLAGRTPHMEYAVRFVAIPKWMMWLYTAPLAGVGALLVVRALIFRREGIGLLGFIGSSLVSGALHAFCCLHVGVGILRSITFGCVGFVPTGARTIHPLRPARRAWAMALPSLIYLGLALLLSREGLGPIEPFASYWAWSMAFGPAVLWVWALRSNA
jgi:hypothetical protein